MLNNLITQYHAYWKFTGSPLVRDTSLWGTKCWFPMMSAIERFHCITLCHTSHVCHLGRQKTAVFKYVNAFWGQTKWLQYSRWPSLNFKVGLAECILKPLLLSRVFRTWGFLCYSSVLVDAAAFIHRHCLPENGFYSSEKCRICLLLKLPWTFSIFTVCRNFHNMSVHWLECS